MKHNWTMRLAVGALVMTCLGGAALAAGQQGTQGDPLVTLSYLTSQATPAILAQVDTKLTQREKALTAQLGAVVDGYVKQVADKLGSGGAPSAGGPSASYAVVTLSKGQTLTAKAGCEILARGGGALCVAASAPGLVDMTDGTTLSTGTALVANHLYLATADGRGVRASEAVTLLVRGGYAIA